MAAMLSVLRLIALVIGGTAFAIGLVAGRNEAGKVQSYVLNFWAGLTAFGEAATSKHARFVRGTAKGALTALEWVFGKRILALRCVWTAFLLSLSSTTLAAFSAVGLAFLALGGSAQLHGFFKLVTETLSSR